jgi:hypothetical protein
VNLFSSVTVPVIPAIPSPDKIDIHFGGQVCSLLPPHELFRVFFTPGQHQLFSMSLDAFSIGTIRRESHKAATASRVPHITTHHGPLSVALVTQFLPNVRKFSQVLFP